MKLFLGILGGLCLILGLLTTTVQHNYTLGNTYFIMGFLIVREIKEADA